MAIRFIVDSASDILPAEAKELGIIHLPMTVMFGETTYRDAVDLTHQEFYEKLIESDELPKTSQINPSVFEDAYREVTEAGDTAIVITVSSKLSGTFQSANIAADDYEGKVFVVDSESACVGERLLALRGLELCKEGLGWSKATTYTVIRRLSERGVLKNENTIVSSLISKEEAQKSRLEEMVEETFEGSMPAFIAAFSKTRKLTRQETQQLKALIDSFEEE